MSKNSALYCEHANEVPTSCKCPPDCYCKSHTCKPRRSPASKPTPTPFCSPTLTSATYAMLEAQARAMRKDFTSIGDTLQESTDGLERWFTQWLARAFTNNWTLELPHTGG